jgi:glycosyltransferase involved in cell wall biosynthesis
LGIRQKRLHDLTDEQLDAVYRGAELVLVPSLVEGFGLPVLEAFARGAPVLASAIQPLQRTGADVARYVRGESAEWAEAITGALDDGAWQASSRVRGPEQAARFPWSETAASTARAYQEAAS